MQKFSFSPIGKVISNTSPSKPSDSIATIEIDEIYIEGLSGLTSGQHIQIVFVFDKSEGYSLITMNKKFNILTGLFNTRSPYRPNPIGITAVEIIEICDGKIVVKGGDFFADTPILDIKPWQGTSDY